VDRLVFPVAIERIAPTIDEHKKGASKTTRPLHQVGSFITADFIDEPLRCRPRAVSRAFD
jgi:hypothetical protein